MSFPNHGVLRQALGDLEFLVVQDGYHPTPTSELAHLVLPAAIWGEKEGTYTNSERRVSKVNRAVAPPGEARSDFDIFLGLADAARRAATSCFPAGRRPRTRSTNGGAFRPGRLCDYSGITYDVTRDARRHPVAVSRRAPPIRPRTRRLYADGQFETADGRAKLLPVAWEPFPEQPTADFPLVLNTGRTVEHWHTRTKTGEVPILERLSPQRLARDESARCARPRPASRRTA